MVTAIIKMITIFFIRFCHLIEVSSSGGSRQSLIAYFQKESDFIIGIRKQEIEIIEN